MNDAWNEWQTFKSEGKKYLVSPVKGEVLKWKDAKAKCEEKGGILASNLSPKWFKKFPEKIKICHLCMHCGLPAQKSRKTSRPFLGL